MTRDDVSEMLDRGRTRVVLARCLSAKFRGKVAELVDYDAEFACAVVKLPDDPITRLIEPDKMDLAPQRSEAG